jgi:hypothetical protein
MFRRRPKSSPVNPIRDTLFGEMPLDRWPDSDRGAGEFPWSAFVAARSELSAGRLIEARALWRRILGTSGLGTRHYLQSAYFLRQAGEAPSGTAAAVVLGVVVEVALPEGIDLLAAYTDHTARYYNHGGRAVIWERADSSLDQRIDALVAASTEVVKQIGPSGGPRPGPPAAGHARLSFLIPQGVASVKVKWKPFRRIDSAAASFIWPRS